MKTLAIILIAVILAAIAGTVIGAAAGDPTRTAQTGIAFVLAFGLGLMVGVARRRA